ncbi:MAG: endonuclease/exonuclease/phosphatase family protein, partial [Acidimicrobiales bacterium]
AMATWLAGHPADIVVVLDTKLDIAEAFHDGVNGYRMIYPQVKAVTRRTDPATKKDPKPKKKAGGTDTTVAGAAGTAGGLDPTTTTTAPPTTTSTTTGGGTTVDFIPSGAELVVLTDRDDVTAAVPSGAGLPESAIEIHTTIGDRSVSLLGLHTQSPTSSANHDRRDRQLAAVTTWLQDAPRPAIAFGDFNVTYYSPVLRHLLDDTGARSSQLGFGVQATWPVQFRPAGIGIDQSIYTGDLTAVGRRRGPSFGSEHRVLIVTYALAG